MLIRILKNCVVLNTRHKVGDVLEASSADSAYLIARGLAARAEINEHKTLKHKVTEASVTTDTDKTKKHKEVSK